MSCNNPHKKKTIFVGEWDRRHHLLVVQTPILDERRRQPLPHPGSLPRHHQRRRRRRFNDRHRQGNSQRLAFLAKTVFFCRSMALILSGNSSRSLFTRH